MSDWRGGDKDDKRRRDNKPKSKPLPVILPKQAAPSSGTRPINKDWRGNTKSSSSVPAEGERTWTGAKREKAASTSGLKKSILVGLLGLAISSLFIAFVLPLFLRNPELPVVISITGTHASDDIGENPFGQQTIKQLQDAKPPSLNIISSTEASDQFLREVKANEEWAKNFNGTTRLASSGKITGAGPGKNVIVYFVSCFVARADSNGKQTDEWVLLSRDDDPYWQPSKNSDAPLPISQFLERIAKQTSVGSYAWIVLDVKPPTVVTNLGDLEFSVEAFEGPFRSLDKQLQDRLILSLPCDQSQESWMAPEFSSSVFAHFFWQGIASGFETERGIVTLKDFEPKLIQKVQEWVALNRFARQTPIFLMSEATEKSKKDIKLLDMAGKPYGMPPSATRKEDVGSKFRELDELWKRFYQLRNCMRWEPMRYAKIESQLIQMEELGECNAQNKWEDFRKRVDSDIKNLERDTKFKRSVSLIESRQHSLVRPGVFDTDVLEDRKSRATPWIVNPTDTNSKPKEPDPRSATPRDVRCLQVWNFLESEAKSGNAGVWEKTLRKTHLSQCLVYCDLQKEQGRNEWLEIQVLRIVLDAMKSEDDSSKSCEAIARTIGTFSDLSEIAFDPIAELSRWTKNQLIDLDKQFLKAFDLLVANQFDQCIQELKKMQNGITKLKVDFDTWKEAMATRDEVLWITPHFLAALMRDYRYSPKPQEILQATRELRTVLNDAVLIRDSLEDADRPVNSLSSRPSITRQELDKLKAKLNQEFVELANQTVGDAETIPRIRMALRWPLLPFELREKFHAQLTKLYFVVRSAGVGVSDVKFRSPSLVATEFCKGLDDRKGKSFYQSISSNDPRLSSLEMISKDASKELSSEPSKIVPAIYGVSYLTRMISNSFGQRAAASRPRDEDWRWPWNSATQFNQINTAYYNQLQSERLCLARWGDGNLGTAQPLGLLYFERLEKEFELSSQLLRNYDQANPISRKLEMAHAEYKKNSVEEVKQIGVTIPALEQGIESSVPVSLESKVWEAIATLSVHRDEKMDRLSFSNRTKNRSASVQMDGTDKNVNVIMDSSLFAIGDKLRISVRGNYRESPVVAKDDTNSYSIRFQRPTNKPSTILVKAKSDPITLWVLLDCSGSMTFNNIHEKARGAATNLLKHIQELNESGECPINVGLIVFGRQPDDNVPSELTQCRIGNQIFKSRIKTGSEISDLITLVQNPWVEPSGCTPLYDAIYTACEGVKADGRNWIVVISDGSNDVNLLPAGEKEINKYYITNGGNKNSNQLKKKLIDSRSTLFVGQYDNERFYKEAVGQDGTLLYKNAEKSTEIAEANKDLRKLMEEIALQKLGQANSQLFYKDFERLEADLIDKLPYSTVTVESNGQTIEGRFGKNIELQVKEPIDATVKIQSFFGQTASTKISLVGGEGLKFIYSDIAGLDCIKFNDDSKTPGRGTDFSQMQSGMENRLRVFAKCTPHSDSSMYQLALQVAIRGTAAENIEQKLFTRRPEFVLAAIKTAGGGPETSTLISDSGFLPMTHYPILLFPNIPWKQDDKWLSEQIDVDVWMANELPEKAKKISLKSRDQQELFDKIISCKRTGNDVTVKIQSRNADRFFVICNSAKASTRTIVEGKETEAKFELQEGDEKPVELVVIKESDLKQSVQQGNVKHYWFYDMKFLKR